MAANGSHFAGLFQQGLRKHGSVLPTTRLEKMSGCLIPQPLGQQQPFTSKWERGAKPWRLQIIRALETILAPEWQQT
eukprot:3059161-Amphidinium_carterae.1